MSPIVISWISTCLVSVFVCIFYSIKLLIIIKCMFRAISAKLIPDDGKYIAHTINCNISNLC